MTDRPIPAGVRPSLLLVEDDAAAREAFAVRLQARGCTVVAVDAAEEGVVEASGRAFDAVIADVHLPGLSGIEFASWLLAQDPAMPVILVTGDPDEDLAREALSRGPVSYLVKPIQPFELESVLQQALTRRGWRVEPGGGLVKDVATGPEVPTEWLDYVESESFAGPGHGERIARIALLLLEEVPVEEREIIADDLALAARIHEVGRLSAPEADPASVAAQSAELMAEAGFPRAAVRAVRHMHEQWDGSGGPDGLAGSSVPAGACLLAAADAVDHYAAAWLQGGLNADNAVDRAIHLVTVQQGRVFSPAVVAGLHRRIEDVRRIIVTWRDAESSETLTTAAFARGLAAMPFKVA